MLELLCNTKISTTRCFYMNIIEVVLFFALFGSITIAGFKVYNIKEEGRIITWQVSILLFCVSALLWFMSLLCFASSTFTLQSVFYQYSHKLVSLLLIVSGFFTFCEILYFLKNNYFRQSRAYIPENRTRSV